MDIETLVSSGTQVLFAVDQNLFMTGGNRFCVLCPLMTVDGERFRDVDANFPNRGRVWWMLRDDIPETDVRIGSIWCGSLEHAMKFDEADPAADKFQVDKRTIRRGHGDYYQVIDLPEGAPTVREISAQRRFPWHRPVLSRAFLHGPRDTLGPVKAVWSEQGYIAVEAINSGKPEALKVPTADFDRMVRVERFRYNGNRYDPYAESVEVEVSLALDRWVNLQDLRESGSAIDFADDSQVLNWGLKMLGLTRAQSREVKAVLKRLTEDGESLAVEEAMKDRLERLARMAGDMVINADASDEAIRIALESESFRGFVERHVERLTAARVESQVESRRIEVENKLSLETKKLETLRQEVAKFEAERDRLVNTAEDEALQAKAAVIEAIEKREAEVELRKRGLEEQERSITNRLANVAARFHEEREKVIEDLVSQAAILGSIGVFKSPGAESVPQSKHGSTAILPRRPADAPKAVGSLTEEEFLEQFKDVVRRRGFVFGDDDLAAYHVTVKTAGLTVLAGASGIGKSSLPRLYAEALGCREEFLQVGVRPDWLDDRDILGAYNPLSRRFEAGACGLVDRLISAQDDLDKRREGIYIISLDEMNLARVEHYFARFLEIMELPARNKVITLFAEGLANPDDPYSRWREIRLGGNVRFLGTVNIDETTHFFSPKVLDRAAIVSFASPDLKTPPPASSEQVELGGITPVSFEQYSAWQRPAIEGSEARGFLLEVDSALRPGRMGLGYRAIDRMLSFVASAKPFMSMDAALDFQLLQRVFPRCRRVGPEFDRVMESLKTLVPRDRFPRACDVLDRMVSSGAENDYLQLL